MSIILTLAGLTTVSKGAHITTNEITGIQL